MAACRPLTPEQFRAVRDVLRRGANGLRNAAMFSLGCTTGFRISELLSIDLGDVVFDGELADRVVIAPSRLKRGRSSRTAWIVSPAREDLIEWIRELNSFGGVFPDCPIFCTRSFRRLTRFGAYKILRAAYRAAGLRGVGYATHTLRKTFARNAERVALRRLRDGADVNPLTMVQAVLGHAQVTSTQRYLASCRDQMEDVFRLAAAEIGEGTK